MPARQSPLVLAVCLGVLTGLAGPVPIAGADREADVGADGSADVGSRGGGPPVAMPEHPHGLPAPVHVGREIEQPAGYQPQLSCAAAPMRGTARLRDLVLKTYGPGSDGGTIRSCASGGQSEHKEGRAWDWMVDVGDRRERRAAADFLAWLTAPSRDGEPGAMARRLGVMYVIYNRRIWASYRGSWTAYGGDSPHTDHVHVSLSWNGARGHTSFWTGRVWATDVGTCVSFDGQPAAVASKRPRTRPCPEPAETPRTSSQPVAWLGNVGDHVRTGQRLLGVDTSGVLDGDTRRALLRWQRHHDLPRTGALDKPTWAALQPSTRRQLAPRWSPAEAARWGRDHGSPVLHRSSAGTGVYALQTALRMPARLRTGYFGRRTAAAVVSFRTAHDLGAKPRTDRRTWAALPR